MDDDKYKLGIYDKYVITKTDNSPIDPDAYYFVLRLDMDKHARVAAKAYADSVRAFNPVLAEQLEEKVAEYSKQPVPFMEAYLASREGKDIYCMYKGCRIEYRRRRTNNMVYHEDYIADGLWYIVG
jgi:hypothetical protein